MLPDSLTQMPGISRIAQKMQGLNDTSVIFNILQVTQLKPDCHVFKSEGLI